MKLLPVLQISQFNEFSQKGDFYANDFAIHLATHHARITKPHKHNFYLVVLFTKGKGTHEVDFKSYPIERGSLFLLSPGQTHHWEFEEKAEGYIFFHSKEFYQLFFPNRAIEDYPAFYSTQNSPYLKLTEDMIFNYETSLKNLLLEYKGNALMKYSKLALMIDLLYIDIMRLYVSDSIDGYEISEKSVLKLKKLEALIDKNYLIEKKPKFYASELNISIKHLNKTVLHTINKTTSDLIHERVLLEAKRLLVHGKDNIQEIAFYLGYDDVSYFSRFFKKKTGYKPSEFGGRYNDKE